MVYITFLTKNVLASLWGLALLETIIKAKKIHRVSEFNQSQWLKPYVEFSTIKIIKAEKNADKDDKVLYTLINNVVYGKAMEKLRNRIDVKLVSNEKDYMKWASKPSYMSQNKYSQHVLECAY